MLIFSWICVDVSGGGIMIHELKISPEYYNAIAFGHKTFEVRKNDRDYKIGDWLLLKEWDGQKYTGRTLKRYVAYVFYGNSTNEVFGIKPGHCVMALKRSAPMRYIDGDF